jgi:2-dehydropantoate 2-reductase
MLRHAVLGAGGVGTFLGAALARAGRDVLLVMREESLARYGGVVHVESAVLGDFQVDVPAAAALESPVDVVWVTTKAPQLPDALERVPPAALDGATAVPLMNGIDHVELLRRRYGTEAVLAATIAIESERVEPGRVRQLSGFAIAALAPGPKSEEICAELVDAGLDASIGDSEADVLWRKLAFLAPIALTTTLRGSALDGVVADPEWRSRLHACVREATAVANADGGRLDADQTVAQIEAIPPGLRSSMLKDREAGRPTEIDAIGGAIVRAAARHGLDVPTTQELVDGVRAGEPNSGSRLSSV